MIGVQLNVIYLFTIQFQWVIEFGIVTNKH